MSQSFPPHPTPPKSTAINIPKENLQLTSVGWGGGGCFVALLGTFSFFNFFTFFSCCLLGHLAGQPLGCHVKSSGTSLKVFHVCFTVESCQVSSLLWSFPSFFSFPSFPPFPSFPSFSTFLPFFHFFRAAYLATWLARHLAVWLAHHLASCLLGWLPGYLCSCLAISLPGWLAAHKDSEHKVDSEHTK